MSCYIAAISGYYLFSTKFSALVEFLKSISSKAALDIFDFWWTQGWLKHSTLCRISFMKVYKINLCKCVFKMSITDTFVAQSSQRLRSCPSWCYRTTGKLERSHFRMTALDRMCFSLPLIPVTLNVITGLIGLTLINCCHAYSLFTATFSFSSHRQLKRLHARSLVGAGKSMKVSFLALFQYLCQILKLGGTWKVFTQKNN